MDLDTYDKFVRYLNDPKQPLDLTIQQRKQFAKNSKTHFVQDGILYQFIKKLDKHTRHIIKITEIESILFNTHTNLMARHFAADATIDQINKRYLWKDM